MTFVQHVLVGLPKHVQNEAARLVFGLGHFDHVTSSLIHLCWLPLSYRVKFKLFCYLIHVV